MQRDKKQFPKVFEYKLPRGWKVLAGKTDNDNDLLSLKIADPGDWWFHVHGMAGSHVVLRERPGEVPDRNTLKRAAAIAAFHTKRAGEGLFLWRSRGHNTLPNGGSKAGNSLHRQRKDIKSSS